MFGRNLSETVTHEARKIGGYIPILVERCVEFIREKGLSDKFACTSNHTFTVPYTGLTGGGGGSAWLLTRGQPITKGGPFLMNKRMYYTLS